MSGRRQIHSAPVHAQLRGVAVSSLHDAPRQPFAPNFRSPRAAIDGMTSVCPSSSRSRSRRHGVSGTTFSKPALFQRASRLTAIYTRRNFARTALLKAFGSQIIDPPKTAAVSSSCSSTHNLTTKQRAPRSQKRAGAETTLRTAWIERPIFS